MSTTNNDRSVKLNFTELRQFHDVVNIALNREALYDTQVNIGNDTQVTLVKSTGLHCNIKGNAATASIAASCSGNAATASTASTASTALAAAPGSALEDALAAKIDVPGLTLVPDVQQIGGDIVGTLLERFGSAVSMSADGSRIVIGTDINQHGGGDGHVSIYQRDVNNTTVAPVWTQLGGDIAGEAAGDYFGGAVSMSADGTTVAIGATSNDGDPNNPKSNSGHVRVYQYWSTNDSWTKMGQDIDGEAANDYAGNSVSLSADGNIVAIGSTGNDSSNYSNSGHVRVYQYGGVDNNGIDLGWSKLGSNIGGAFANDMSGHSVSLSADGTIVAIGATGADNGSYSGHVRVHQFVSGDWSQMGQDIDGEAADDSCGYSVSLNDDGDIVAIGAVGAGGTGHVRVHQFASGAWTQLGGDIAGEAASDQFGYSVSLSADGTIVAIGAPYNDDNGSGSGHVRVFKYNSSDSRWFKMVPDIVGENNNDNSGISVSLSADGSIVAIGAHRFYVLPNGVMSGRVRVYSLLSQGIGPLDINISGSAASAAPGSVLEATINSLLARVAALENA